MPYATPPQETPAETGASRPPHDPVDRPADGTESTIMESVVTTFAGMALGATMVWFLAPICFSC